MKIDPITLVHKELWEILESWDDFTCMVSPGCRVKYAMEEGGDKGEVLTADFPQVRITAEGHASNLQISSGSCRMDYNFTIEVSSGVQRLDDVLFPLEWTIFRALVGWNKKLSLLTWNGSAFVKGFEVAQAITGTPNRLPEVGAGGWISIWSVTVAMIFARTAVKDTAI